MKTGVVLGRLYDLLKTAAESRSIRDLRVGLSYVGLLLDDRRAGLAAVLPDTAPRGCTVLKKAGTYAGACAAELLKYLVAASGPLERSIGLATANALICSGDDYTDDREATTFFNLQPDEKVAMVGLFSPLVGRIRATGAVLTVIEKNPKRLDLLTPEEKRRALKECDVAIITATTLINGTFEETIGLLGSPREVAVMGPSTPLEQKIFSETCVTHLGGSIVEDAGRALQIISEGGGTPALRPYLKFVNVVFDKD